MQGKLQQGIRRYLVPVLVVIVGTALSTAAFYAASGWENQKLRDAFQSKVMERNAALEQEIQINLLVVASVQAYSSHGRVARDSFSNFAHPLLQQHKSIRAIEYIPRVSDREREAWESTAREEGVPGFQLREREACGTMRRATPRNEYFPVYYIEPSEGNRCALGFDLASDPVRKVALERSRDTGELVSTAPVVLVQSKQRASGVLVFAPLYRSLPANPSVAERRQNLTGFALGVFCHGDILERTLAHFQPAGIDVYIYDKLSPGAVPIYVHRSKGSSREAAPSGADPLRQKGTLQCTRSVNVAGRQWLVLYRATPDFAARGDEGRPLMLLAIGLLLTAVLASYLRVVIRRAEVVGRLVEKRTRELRQEIKVRSLAEQELQKAQAELENRVEERTAALTESEQRYRQLFHRNPLPMWVYDLQTLAFLDVNTAAVRAYGFSREEFLAMTIKDICPSEDIPELIVDVRKAKHGFRDSGIWRHLKKDGGLIFVAITMHRFDFGGKDAELVLAHDVTARLQADQEKETLEAQLRQSQKMEAIGTLAGGIAHDFNNILTAIVGYATLLQMRLTEESHHCDYVGRILAAAERAATLTRSLLAYSRKQVSKPRSIDLGGVVRGVSALLRGLIPESIEVSMLLAEGELTVMADPGQIEQVLMNLATNARDAMPEGGRLEIATEPVQLGPEFVTTYGYGEPGRYIALKVSDTGCGMDKGTCERIFEPFFTTKEVGKGTGLGLSMAYGIIKQHKGYINVESAPGAGTTFTIYLPVTDEVALPSQPAPPFLPQRGMETVLLIEDDPEIRTPLKELLELEGYSVKVAVNGEDGVQRFREWQEEVHLVIVDVVMPKMNGKAVYEEIQKVRPGVKALFISGYTDELVTGTTALPASFSLVSKPIRLNKLLVAMREALA